MVGSDQGVEEGHCRGFIVGRLNASARQNATASVLSLSFFLDFIPCFAFVCLSSSLFPLPSSFFVYTVSFLFLFHVCMYKAPPVPREGCE